MDFEKYKYFYINGGSTIEGGGLEEESAKNKSVIPVYEKLYNVSWNNRTEVNCGTRLSSILGIKCFNESICGGGPERVVRMTYEFIHKNWSERDRFFIMLEKPDSGRYELIYKKEYYVCNTIQYDDKDYKDFSFATRDYFVRSKYNKDKENQKIFSDYHYNFFDLEYRMKKMDFEYSGLYSFCKRNNIKIFLMMTNDFYFNENYDEEDIVRFEKNKLSDILTYCKENNLIITDETNKIYPDFHPGFFGHIEYAKKLAQFLGWTGPYPDLPNYYELKKLII